MKFIILGRDGVINQASDTCIISPQQWIPIKGSLEAIAQLNRGGYRVIVVTNQPCIGQGLLDIQTLHSIHDKMFQQLNIVGGQIESIFFCPHSPDDACDCHKPHAGLLQDIQNRLNISLQDVPVVAHSLDDLKAASEIGAIPVLLRSDNNVATIANKMGLDKVAIYSSLAEYVTQLSPDS